MCTTWHQIVDESEAFLNGGTLAVQPALKRSSCYANGGLATGTFAGHSGLKLVSAEDSPLGGSF